jgi:serine/threonine protein kinase/tetratricopeptide (TPR) repeat protein
MKETQPVRVRFGAFELDLKAGELRLAAEPEGESRIVLPDQPFRLLVMLVERQGMIVTREEIQKKFWPNDTIVEFDHSINVAIGKLRKALGDSADEPKYIETIARRGYRLMVPVERVEAITEEASSVEASTDGKPAELIKVDSSGLTGKTVSHYRVLEVIGGGGMGVVYKAEDLKLGRAVAIKFLPEDVGNDPRALQQFEREARAASSLEHPNICSIYEFGEHDGQPFIVMHLLQGQTLRESLASGALNDKASGGHIALGQLLDIAIQITNGLEAAHEKGIVHRDIKPANIFITTKGVAKILDFSLAKLPFQSSIVRAIPVGVAAGEAVTHNAAGTAAYMSPEQVRGQKLDPRSDLFSFGLVLYEMATGRQAFIGDNPTTLHEAILSREPIPPGKLNPELPVKVQDVIRKCLEKDRELRYQEAAEIRSDLEKVKRRSDHPVLSRWKLLAAMVIVVVALLAGGLYWQSHRAIKFTDQDTIVIADFDNKTGDPVFDDALKTGLTVALNQSPFLNVLSDNRVAQTLKLMTRATDTKLTPDVARELCQRADGQAYISGFIARLGSEYVMGLKAVNCQSGEPLAQEQVTAASKEKVLNALGDAAAKLRGQLGESLTTVQKFDAPLCNVTTSSLEALQAYSLGRKATAKGQAEPIPFFKQAIELDPKFAMAYEGLAIAYANLGEQSRSIEYAKKSYDLREHLSEAERFAVSQNYYFNGLGDVPKAIEVGEAWSQEYPNSGVAYGNLAASLASIGQWEKALAASNQAVRLAPDTPNLNVNVVLDRIALDGFDEAETALQQASARKVDSELLRLFTYTLAFLKGDSAGMQRQLAWAAQHPQVQDLLLAAQANTDAYYGRLAESRAASQQAVHSALRADAKENAATWQAYQALWAAEFGNTAQSRSDANEALRIAPGTYYARLVSAMALSRAGQTTAAQKLADELAKDYPSDTAMHFFYLPSVRASNALNSHHPEQAIDLLQPATEYELGQCYPALEAAPLYPAYVRGLAFLMAGKGTEATAEFQKLLDHRGIVLNSPLGPLAHLQIGRAYAMAGDTAKAKAGYQNFLTLWKDADPDIPIYQQAKAEYARLR